MQDHNQRLVPGRECGDCKVCCVTLSIDTPEIQKLAASPCRHSLRGGCDIYETRPPVCRAFFCGWRRSAAFPENWRPDTSGVFAVLEENIDPRWGPLGVALKLLSDPIGIVRQPAFIDFVIRNLSNNIALYLMLPGPKGMQSPRVSLNNPSMMEAAARSPADVGALLEGLVARLAAHPFTPHAMEYRGRDVST
jgi:hypothetical protein